MDRGTGRFVGSTGALCRRLALAVVMCALFAPGANATAFGIPLGSAPFNVAPNNPYDCSVYLTEIGPAPVYGPAGGLATSCIWIDVPAPDEIAAFPGQNITLEPPASGTVTDIRVAVGSTTGPMRVVVMRTLYRNTATPGKPEDACCFPVAQSQVFTPRPDAITAVRVDLPVREDATPPPEDLSTIADFDTLGLAVLEPRVPVPMYYTGTLSEPADLVWNTAAPSTVTPGFYTDTGGFAVALNGDWSPGAGSPIDFGTTVAPVRNGNATVTLGCLQLLTCAGQILLQNGRIAAADGAGGRAAARTTYGSESFQIASGQRAALSVHLNRAGRGLLARRRRAIVWAIVRASGAKPFATRITLRR